jgi:hypothetical protein
MADIALLNAAQNLSFEAARAKRAEKDPQTQKAWDALEDLADALANHANSH